MSHRNPPIASVPPRQLDRRLIALRAGITKERPVGTRILAQPRRQLALSGRIVQIANVVQLRHLLAHGLREGGIVVSERARGYSRYEIEVGPSRVGGQCRSGAGDEGYGISAVRPLDARVE